MAEMLDAENIPPNMDLFDLVCPINTSKLQDEDLHDPLALLYQELQAATSDEQVLFQHLDLKMIRQLPAARRVFLCRPRSRPHEQIVVKVLDTSADAPFLAHRARQEYHNQVELLRKLDGESATKFVGAMEFPSVQKNVILTEFYPGGTVTDALVSGRLSTDLALSDLFISLCHAVRHIHGLDIAHRNLCTDNILLDSTGQPVITGFGSAVQLPLGARKVRGYVGTRPFIAPEVTERPHRRHNVYKIDAYALGVILGMLLFQTTALPPISEMLALIANAKIPYENIQAVFQELIPNLLVERTKVRFNVVAILKFLFIRVTRVERIRERLRVEAGHPPSYLFTGHGEASPFYTSMVMQDLRRDKDGRNIGSN